MTDTGHNYPRHIKLITILTNWGDLSDFPVAWKNASRMKKVDMDPLNIAVSDFVI